MTNYERIKNMSVDELTDTMKSELGTLADFTDLIKSSTIKEFAENIDNQLLALKKTYRHIKEKCVVDACRFAIKEMLGEE